MMIRKEGQLTIQKDGTSYYRVFKKRKRIGSFLELSKANRYFDKRREENAK